MEPINLTNKATQLYDFLKNADRYRENPLDYLVERLGVRRETIDWSLLEAYKTHKYDGTANPLLEIINAIANNQWVAVESGTGTGKTFLAACIALWFIECFESSIVVINAPKEAQLKLHVWKEIERLYPKFGVGKLGKLKLRMNEDNDDWIIVGFVAGIRANEESATKAQGFHGRDMLIIFEETPGIPEPVMNAFQNTSTAPHNLILALGNPDHQLDTLHKFSNLKNVKSIRISALDHPNIVLNDANFIAGAESVIGIERMLERFKDKNNPMYLSRVRGISPAQARDALIRLEWCYEARRKYYELLGDNEELNENDIQGLYALGVDVSNSETGDEASAALGKGNILLNIESFPCGNSNNLGHQIHIEMKTIGIRAEYVAVDGIGVGAGTVNALLEDGDKVVDIQSSEAPIEIEGMVERFGNLRAQMWWQMRIDLQDGNIILPNDEELYADLVTPLWFIRQGKIYIEEKSEIKKRLGRSPNKGDAAIYWNWVRTLRAAPAAVVGLTRKKEDVILNEKGVSQIKKKARYGHSY